MDVEICRFEDMDKRGIIGETLAVFLRNSHLVLIYFTNNNIFYLASILYVYIFLIINTL